VLNLLGGGDAFSFSFYGEFLFSFFLFFIFSLGAPPCLEMTKKGSTPKSQDPRNIDSDALLVKDRTVEGDTNANSPSSFLVPLLPYSAPASVTAYTLYT